MAELYIIPECYVDTNLIETLVPTAKGYNHQKGCNNVVKVMKEKLSDKFAVGIVTYGLPIFLQTPGQGSFLNNDRSCRRPLYPKMR